MQGEVLEPFQVLSSSFGSGSRVFLRALSSRVQYRGTSLIRNSFPPLDHHKALGTVLLKGTGGALFPMSEVPLYVGCASQE